MPKANDKKKQNMHWIFSWRFAFETSIDVDGW